MSAFDLERDFSAENVIRHVMGVEGGSKHTDIKEDRGGSTRYGVTEGLAKHYSKLWSKYGFNGDMRQLPEALAYDIYYIEFWQGMSIESFARYSKLLAYTLFDIGVNGGKARALMHVQRFLNACNDRQKLYGDIKRDGDFGARSVEALNAFVKARGNDGIETLHVAVFAFQFVFYTELSERDESQEKFTYGWYRRVVNAMESFKYHIFRQ